MKTNKTKDIILYAICIILALVIAFILIGGLLKKRSLDKYAEYNPPAREIVDADGDTILAFSSDSLCGRVIYYFKDLTSVSFYYSDVISFASEESLDAFLSNRADALYGEGRPEFGYTVIASILFDSDLHIKDVRLITKNIEEEKIDKMVLLINHTEGHWGIKNEEVAPQPYYLKFVSIHFN